MQTLRLSLGAAVAAICLVAQAADSTTRNRSVRAAFQRTHPCPETHQTHGPCPGYVVDHHLPLCAGGEDRPENMQWQTRAEGLAKDRREWELCRLIKRARNSPSHELPRPETPMNGQPTEEVL